MSGDGSGTQHFGSDGSGSGSGTLHFGSDGSGSGSGPMDPDPDPKPTILVGPIVYLEVTKKRGRPKLTQDVVDQRAAAKQAIKDSKDAAKNAKKQKINNYIDIIKF